MARPLPTLQIDQKQLSYLVAVLMVYRKYRREKTPPTAERLHTLIVLEYLIPKLNALIDTREEPASLLFTTDDVHVLKAGFTMLLDRLNKKSPTPEVRREIQRLKELKTLIDQTFKVTQD